MGEGRERGPGCEASGWVAEGTSRPGVASRTRQEEENLRKVWVKKAGLEVESAAVGEVKREWKEARGKGGLAALNGRMQ